MSLAIQSFILFRNCNCNEYQMSGKYSRVPKPPPGTRSRSTLHRLLQPRDTFELAPSTVTEFHKVHFSHVHPYILRTGSFKSMFSSFLVNQSRRKQNKVNPVWTAIHDQDSTLAS